jgi:hypothetical protein
MKIPDLIPAAYECPYCGEQCELLVDPTGGEKQDFVEDCAVCCQPAAISARIGDGVLVSLSVEPES